MASHQRIALDFAVINALGQQHRDQTLVAPLQAAVAYSDRKAAYQNTREQCEAEGVTFEPIVFEAQGGIEPRGAAILHRIVGAVAAAEGTDATRLKSEMLRRLAVIIARASARAIHRRQAPRGKKLPHLRALRQAMAEGHLNDAADPTWGE